MLSKLVTAPSGKICHTVISMIPGGSYEAFLKQQGVEVLSLEMTKGVPSFAAIRHLKCLLEERCPDVLQTWLYHADLLGLLAGKIANVPVITWNIRCSDMDLSRYSLISRMLPHLLAKLSAAVSACVVNSRAGRQAHEAFGYRPKQWALIPNGFDLESLRPSARIRTEVRAAWQVSDDTQVIGMIARFDPMKDHFGLIAVLARLIERGKNVVLVFAGKGCEEQGRLAEEVSRLGLDGQVRLLGEVSEVENILPGFDVFALASFTEGFPNVVGEAMACGVPVVTTDVGDCREIIGETGRVVPLGDGEAFEEALMDLLNTDGETRSRLSVAARERIKTLYSLSAIVRLYEEFYGKLLGRL